MSIRKFIALQATSMNNEKQKQQYFRIKKHKDNSTVKTLDRASLWLMQNNRDGINQQNQRLRKI